MICLYHGVSLISRLIRYRSWCDESHASWLTRGCVGQQLNIEAWHVGGVRYTSGLNVGHTPGTKVDLYDVRLTQGERQALESFLIDQVGKKYDYRGVVRFITRRKASRDEQDRWFCSELLFDGFLIIKLPLLKRVPAHKVYPGMLKFSPRLKYVETKVTE